MVTYGVQIVWKTKTKVKSLVTLQASSKRKTCLKDHLNTTINMFFKGTCNPVKRTNNHVNISLDIGYSIC